MSENSNYQYGSFEGYDFDAFVLIEHTVNSIEKRDLSKHRPDSVASNLATLIECLERIDTERNKNVSEENKQKLRDRINKIIEKIHGMFDQN